jgi:hypothetical protein
MTYQKALLTRTKANHQEHTLVPNQSQAQQQTVLHPMLQLQQQIGNRAVDSIIQAKHQIGASGVHQENKTGLPAHLKAGIENLSGMSIDDVKVHYNSSKPSHLQALAYTQGTDIHVEPGQERHLPHEAWHVVQQKQGRVKPTMRMKDTAINNNLSLEQEADVMGKKAANFGHRKTSATLTKRSSKDLAQVKNTIAVAQMIVPGEEKQINYYWEKKNGNQKELESVSKEEYQRKKSKTADEEGYGIFKLEDRETKKDWKINEQVLQWEDDKTLSARKNFKLPVSCIESAEHIIHYANQTKIPNWNPNQTDKKSVELHFSTKSQSLNRKRTHSGSNEENSNEKAFNISKDDLIESENKEALKKYSNYNFKASPLDLNEGLLVIKPQEPETTMHAVAVVGINKKTGHFIVVERNAGTTSGDNDYTDNKWLLNIYDSPEKFKDSMGSDGYIIGKLVVKKVDEGSSSKKPKSDN